MTSRPPPPTSGSSVRPAAASLQAEAVRSRLEGRVSLRTLVLMRWIAISGQILTVFTVSLCLGYEMPVGPVLAAIGASILLNLIVITQHPAQLRIPDRDAVFYLGYDTLQLTLLLYLTGGLSNPFTILILAPLTVGAAVLSRLSIILLTALSVVSFTVLGRWHFPLPWPGQSPELPTLYLSGVWGGLTMSAVLIAAYVFRVAQESRRIADALTASQMALAREQRLSALGALAAAAAHELGTPLGTIALVTKELVRDVPANSPLADDIALLHSQSQRCRAILAELTRQPEADGGSPFETLGLTTLIEVAAAAHRAASPGVGFEIVPADGPMGPEPVLRRSPEILHGLGNLIQNALQFAAGRVEVGVGWDRETVRVAITDDGPGFPSHVLNRLGEPYLSGRSNRTGHMGLGIFIAETLLERTGAAVEFGNIRGGGARVVVRWDRGEVETAGPEPAQTG